MIMTNSGSIREVIPFPKNSMGISPMDGSPSIIDTQLVDDLHLQWKPIEKKSD
jgi:aspartyl-tRNA synthetase